ncbi:hypothetical protein GGF46_005379, partial [Coemansia sp. RSA 552]
MDDFAHAQQVSTAMRVHLEAAASAAESSTVRLLDDRAQAGLDYGATGHSSREQLLQSDDLTIASEMADDSNPVSAYFEIAAIRGLLLEHVDVVLTPGQIDSPSVQLNLVSPLWQAARVRCGVWRRGDMRKQGGSDGPKEKDRCATDGPLVSAAMLYAALANRDYFAILASAGQSQAELHESRAEVAETLAILCVRALHKLGNRALINALCVKFTPIDVDGLYADIARMFAADSTNRPPQSVPVKGDRHMSLLPADQRVRVYRLGRAGSLGGSGLATPYGTGLRSRAQSGLCATPAGELAQDYLQGGSRIVTEHAIEVAIRSEAKRFTAQKLVGDVVAMLWDGTLHWKGFRCVCLHEPPETMPCPPPLNSQATLTFAFARRQSASSAVSDGSGSGAALNPELPLAQAAQGGSTAPTCTKLDAWLADALAPLRLPAFENFMVMVHAFFFLALYTVVSLQRQASLTVEEAVLHICALAYIADEIRQCRENGLAVYFKSVWNVLDVSIYTVFAAFFCLRLRSLYTGSPDDLDEAYDVLALNASMLWPRLFAVLDQFEFFGTIIIQVRRIISGTSLFFALLLVMTVGFFQTFYALSQRHNHLDAQNIWGLMARIFFGSALLGWDQAEMFGPYVGTLAMAAYIAVSMLILYNILIGVINQCMVDIYQNSAQEFRFAYTMRVVEYVSAHQTYPCVPPLNLLQLVVFWPL